jgi:hypothetical protein
MRIRGESRSGRGRTAKMGSLLPRESDRSRGIRRIRPMGRGLKAKGRCAIAKNAGVIATALVAAVPERIAAVQGSALAPAGASHGTRGEPLRRQGGPPWLQDGPQWLQDGPPWLRDGPQWLQEVSLWRQDVCQRAQRAAPLRGTAVHGGAAVAVHPPRGQVPCFDRIGLVERDRFSGRSAAWLAH